MLRAPKDYEFSTDEEALEHLSAELGLDGLLSEKVWNYVTTNEPYSTWRCGRDEFGAVVQNVRELLELVGEPVARPRPSASAVMAPDSGNSRVESVSRKGLESVVNALADGVLFRSSGALTGPSPWDSEISRKQLHIDYVPSELREFGPTVPLLGLHSRYRGVAWQMYQLNWNPNLDYPLCTQKIMISVSPFVSADELRDAFRKMQVAVGVDKSPQYSPSMVTVIEHWIRNGWTGAPEELKLARKVVEDAGLTFETLKHEGVARQRIREAVSQFLNPGWSTCPLVLDQRSD